MQYASDAIVRERLHALHRALVDRGRDLALLLVYDRPERVAERPDLARAFYAQRCVSDEQLEQTIEAFRFIGSYVELFEGELPLLRALADGRPQALQQPLKIIYNGIDGGITAGGFRAGRKALIPSVADAYQLISSNSGALACALVEHKFHYSNILRSLGVRVPAVWYFRPGEGWLAGRAPDRGAKVIVKSTHESWSVGVTEKSVFVVDDAVTERVAAIANDIGQPVTVQRFVSGPEVYVPIFALPERVASPAMEVVLAKAPGDPDAFVTIHDSVDNAVGYRRYQASSETLDQLTIAALTVFEMLELSSFSRIDFRVDAAGTPWVTDVASSPGLSTDSAGFHSLAEVGFDHAGYLRAVVATTLASRGFISIP